MPIFRVFLEFFTGTGFARENYDVVASTPEEAGKKARAIVRPKTTYYDSIIVRKIKRLRS